VIVAHCWPLLAIAMPTTVQGLPHKVQQHDLSLNSLNPHNGAISARGNAAAKMHIDATGMI
jgi:hypothetical protein